MTKTQIRRVVWFLFSLLPLITPLSARAILVNDLYVAEVLVTDESPEQLRAGSRAGLVQVLERVSGSREIEASTLVRSALRNPAAYYNQYGYESSEKTLLEGDQEVSVKVLRINFVPSAIARLLREANLPVWGSNRPGILLWVALSEGQQRRLLSEADRGELVASLKDQARARGLPLLFPILDLEDASMVSTAEVWGAFLDRIEAASKRYSPDVILTARMQEEGVGRWSSRWSYQISDSWAAQESLAFSADLLARNMIDQIADQLATRFALGASRGNVSLVVDGVRQLQDYAALAEYLEQLTPVLSSSISSLEGEIAEFSLETEGQVDQLVQIIELDGRLILQRRHESGATLFYRWAE